jgi:L-asparaginase
MAELNRAKSVQIFTTGGTIDKIYFDALSEFQVGHTALDEILKEANVHHAFAVTPLMRKDSLDLDDADRAVILDAVAAAEAPSILVTHGTDTMATTAKVLMQVAGKTIVLTGALQPASLRYSDAVFNVGFAFAAAQLLPPGVYIAMNGDVFPAAGVRKDRAANRFVAEP